MIQRELESRTYQTTQNKIKSSAIHDARTQNESSGWLSRIRKPLQTLQNVMKPGEGEDEMKLLKIISSVTPHL